MDMDFQGYFTACYSVGHHGLGVCSSGVQYGLWGAWCHRIHVLGYCVDHGNVLLLPRLLSDRVARNSQGRSQEMEDCTACLGQRESTAVYQLNTDGNKWLVQGVSKDTVIFFRQRSTLLISSLGWEKPMSMKAIASLVIGLLTILLFVTSLPWDFEKETTSPWVAVWILLAVVGGWLGSSTWGAIEKNKVGLIGSFLCVIGILCWAYVEAQVVIHLDW